MNKEQRAIINLVRSKGGKSIRVESGGIHNRVVFSDESGKQHRLPVSRGTGGGSYVLSRTRSQLRRMGLGDQNNHS